MNYFQTLDSYLNEFAQFAQQYPGPIPDSIQFNFKKHKGHVLFGSIIHGNEVGSLPGILSVIKNLAKNSLSYGGKVTFFLGNKKAALQKARFIEFDLNRSFGTSFAQGPCLERARALEITSLLKQAQVFFDFHQTNRPSREAFYIFSLHKESLAWAQAAGVAPFFVTRKPGQSLSLTGLCGDEYMRSLNKAGVTLELGEQGFWESAKLLTVKVVERTLRNMDKVFLGISTLEKLGRKNCQFQTFLTVHREVLLHPDSALTGDFENFDPIFTGQQLGFYGDGKPILSPKDGYIIFPKYPMKDALGNIQIPKLQSELFLLVREFNSVEKFLRSDDSPRASEG